LKMKPYEKPTIKLVVDTYTSIYNNTVTEDSVSAEYLYTVAETHQAGNIDSTFTVVDEHDLIQGYGEQELSITPMSTVNRARIGKYSMSGAWLNEGKALYSTQWPSDVKAYFNQNDDWENTLDYWVTEGLMKDWRLVDSYKSAIIPLPLEPQKYQRLNAHMAWITNTSTGKSSFAHLSGGAPIEGATVASALGSYESDGRRTKIMYGFLHGTGPPLILDEINTVDKPVIRHLLTYLEQGDVIRGLKHQIHTKGTQNLILTGNPLEDTSGGSLTEFLRFACSDVDPQALGRRFGFLCIGDDYLGVTEDGDSSKRREVARVIQTTCMQYRGQIKRMIDSHLKWIDGKEPEATRMIRRYADAIHHDVAREFVLGQSIGCVKKLKTAAVRTVMVEQLYRVPDRTVDFSDVEDQFWHLLDINVDSYCKLATFRVLDESDEDHIRALIQGNPSLGNREISRMVKGRVSHPTIGTWRRKWSAEKNL